MKTLLTLALLMLAGCAEARPEHSAPYAVRLEFSRGLCSGTVVGRNLILSASHCWEGGNRLIKIDGEEHHALEILHDGRDHAIVRVDKQFTRWAALGASPQQGDRISWIGNPAGEADVYREGYVARSTGRELFVIAPGFGGDSGSGLFDGRGQLVGVVSAVRIWQTWGGQRFEVTVAWPLAFSDDDWREIRA